MYARSWLVLAGSVAGCLGVGWLSGVVSGDFGGWYALLEKPAWTPPGAVIGGVWIVLYALMGVAAWLVWREVGFAPGPFGLFALQLALNFAWSPVFFRLQRPGAAFGVIVLLWLAVLATLVVFTRARRAAGLLLAPYLAWVSFAAYLNWLIWRLNL